MAELARFIQAEMRSRKMSARAFADFIGVAASTISQHVNERTREESEPSIEFLRALSAKTGVKLSRILRLAFPEMKGELEISKAESELSDEQLRLLAAYENWDIDTAANLFAERGAALVAEAFRKATPDERGE